MPKYKADKNGIFSTMVWDGTYNADGTKHRKHLRSSKSSRDLEKKVIELTQKVENGANVDGSITFGEYSRHWLELKRPSLAPQTFYDYERALASYLFPLDNIRLDNLLPSHYNSILEGKSPNNVRMMAIIYKQVITLGMQEHRINRVSGHDILDSMIFIKRNNKTRRPLTDAEIEAAFNLKLKPRETCMLYLLYYTGMRRGEALAICKDDIDFDFGTIRVSKTATKFGIQDFPKSKNSTRIIPMASKLKNFLKDYVPNAQFYILARYSAAPSIGTSDRLWENIKDALVKAIPSANDITPHCFRHNFCSSLCYQVPLGKISIKKIAQIMGDNVQTVQRVYDHIIEEREDPIGAIEDAFI